MGGIVHAFFQALVKARVVEREIAERGAATTSRGAPVVNLREDRVCVFHGSQCHASFIFATPVFSYCAMSFVTVLMMTDQGMSPRQRRLR